MTPTQTLPLSKQELLSRRRRSSTSAGGAGEDAADGNQPQQPAPQHSLYRTLRRCRPCVQRGDPDDAFASFDTGREAILPTVGCTSTQTFTSNGTTTTTTSTKKSTTNSSINQSRKSNTPTNDHHLHSSPAWHADCLR